MNIFVGEISPFSPHPLTAKNESVEGGTEGALSDRQRSVGRVEGGIWENWNFADFQVMVIWENALPFVQCLLH